MSLCWDKMKRERDKIIWCWVKRNLDMDVLVLGEIKMISER